MQKSLIIRLAIVAAILLTTIASTFTFSGGNAQAQAATPLHSAKSLNCRNHGGSWWDGSVLLNVSTSTADCYAVWAKASTYVANCDSVPRNANVDTWQTQNTSSGGSRSGETGRSGYVTYPTDCNWYYVQTSNVWLGLSDPAYGCGWMDVSYVGAIDYRCVQF